MEISDPSVLEQPDCQHGEGQQECVQQEAQTVQLMQLQFLFVNGQLRQDVILVYDQVWLGHHLVD